MISKKKRLEKLEKIKKGESLFVVVKEDLVTSLILLFILTLKLSIMGSHQRELSEDKVENPRREDALKSEKLFKSTRDKLRRMNFQRNFQG